jgi:hypothetical protein
VTENPERPRIDWFPGVHTGPTVGVGLTVSEIDLLRKMIDSCPQFMDSNLTPARHVLRDLDVRIGALGELDAAGAREVVLQPHEHLYLTRAFDEYRRYRDKAPLYPQVAELFVQLDRRMGAAQIRLAQSGMMSEEHFPGRVGDIVVDDDGGGDWTPPPPRNRQPLLGSRWPRRNRG